jgi:alpha-ketoglutarate-dependent taurine dioxygenase
MGGAYEKLFRQLKKAAAGTRSRHSVRRYFKIRPTDVYRPVKENLDDIERETAAVIHPPRSPIP